MEALRFLVEAVTKNWGLKLLALALAIILYHSLKPSDEPVRGHRAKTHDRTFFQQS